MTCDYCRRPAKIFYLMGKSKHQYCKRHAKLSNGPLVKRFDSEEERTLYLLSLAL